MDKDWENNIYDLIKDFSDIKKQKYLWLGYDKRDMSSFDEDICLLFDSFCFEDFIKDLSDNGSKEDLVKDLLNFKNNLEKYQKKETDKDILNDEYWLEIVENARSIIENWNV